MNRPQWAWWARPGSVVPDPVDPRVDCTVVRVDGNLVTYWDREGQVMQATRMAFWLAERVRER
jgi:hypothetical protein